MFALYVPEERAQVKDFLDNVNKVIKGYQKFSSTHRAICSTIRRYGGG